VGKKVGAQPTKSESSNGDMMTKKVFVGVIPGNIMRQTIDAASDVGAKRIYGRSNPDKMCVDLIVHKRMTDGSKEEVVVGTYAARYEDEFGSPSQFRETLITRFPTYDFCVSVPLYCQNFVHGANSGLDCGSGNPYTWRGGRGVACPI